MPEKVQLNAGGIPIIIVQVFLPIILAIIGGYGAVKYTFGETQQQIMQLQQTTTNNTEEINRVRQNSVTREEMRLILEQTRQDLQEIKADIRAIRYSESRK